MAKKDRVGGKIQIDRESPEFKARVQRSRESRQKRKEETGDTFGGRAKRAFGERLLGSYGLGREHFTEGGFVKGKLGLFAEAINNRPNVQAAPDMEKPKTESNINNPNISALINQLELILEVAKRVGVVTTAQQRSYQQQTTSSTRQSRERSMEGNIASLLASMMGTGTSFDPLTTEVGTLIEKIKPLQDAIEEQTKQAQEAYNNRGFAERLADRYGLGDEYRDYDKRKQARQSRVKTKPGFTMTRTRTGQTRFIGPDGRFTSRAAAIADAVPTRMQRATSAVRSGGAGLLNLARRAVGSARNAATRVGGARIATGTSRNIASIVGRGMQRAGAAASATKSVSASVVKRVAGPIISKAIGSTVLKSIPIVGTAIGGLFAAKKLVQGDVVGAGLEAASGLGGPLTAIPAMIASVSRDTYSSVFGVKPESDPNFVSRMALITGIITALVTAMLASKVDAKQRPTQAQIDKATIPEARPNATVTAGTTPSGAPKPVPAAPAPSPAPSPTPSPSPSRTSTPTPTPSPSPAPSAAATPSASAAAATPTPSSPASATPTPTATPPTPSPSPMSTIVETPPVTSEALSKASVEAEAAARGVGVINIGGGNDRPLPSRMPPTRSGVSGAGDVPDPHYFGLGQVADAIYFNANPSIMA